MQTTPQTEDLQAAIKKTLHSAAFAKFMGQAVQAAIAEAQPPGVLLPPLGKIGRPEFHYSNQCVVYTNENQDCTQRLRLQCEIIPERPSHAGIWYGSETRTDATGREWRSSLGDHVVDDFGNLVEVPA